MQLRVTCMLCMAMSMGAYAAAPITSINTMDSRANYSPVSYDTPTNTAFKGASSAGGSDVGSSSQRLSRIENQLQYLDGLSSRLQSQQQTITSLQTEVESLTHQMQLLQQNQRALSILEQRVMQLEARAKLAESKPKPAKAVPKSTAAANAATAVPSVAPSPAETQAFNAAYNLVVNNQFDAAIKAFQDFIKAYPQSQQLVDAYYWLGELYLSEGQADLATQQFRQVITLDPKNPKAPDAMLKLGTIFLTNGDAEHAKQMFKRVATEYKDTPYGNLAAKQLQSMQ